jgi:glycerol-3-phosphate O-acyltransferase
MDPAFVNWALYNNGFDTVRIAIGDNLVRKAYIGDLMRLNKSFIVRRNLSGPREILKTYSALSGYIRDSIDTGHSVWIAHREGRAKDGIDATDPAILKMLAMAGKVRNESFAQALSALRIVPVSISYEFDPCAPMKARELRMRREHGDYTKAENEDLISITTGILGWKGRVHLHFGEVIPIIEDDDPSQLASRIDQSIHAGQRIFDTSRLADQLLKGEPIRDGLLPDVVARFKALLDTTPDADRIQLLEIYANPLRQFTAHQESQFESI